MNWAASTSWPLVSCIMPTRNRPRLVAQAYSYFQRQRYPNKELIVVADGASLTGILPETDRVRLVEVPDLRTIGEKRNISCAFARGDIIVQWDDDDWYGPRRLDVQVQPLIEGRADITGLTCDTLLDLATMQCWTCSAQEHSRLFGQVASGTLAFRARVWQDLARYPKQSLAEDAAFLHEATRRGARLEAIRNHGQFVYVRHDNNSWCINLNRSCSRSVRSPLRRRDRRFYASLNSATEKPVHVSVARRGRRETPLVSCIMPTSDRHKFVPLALEYFHRQDYPERELVVVDDGQSSIEDLVGKAENVRYFRVAPGLSLGQKRNLACEKAAGPIICHWDDDDWYSSARLSYQVRELIGSEAQVCGLSELMFFDTRAQRGWRYSYGPGERAWLAGATLCYWRSRWLVNPFDDLDSGEDNRFVSRSDLGEVLRHSDISFFVGMIHDSNTSPKRLSAPSWTEIRLDQVRQTLGGDFDKYRVRTAGEPGGSIMPSISYSVGCNGVNDVGDSTTVQRLRNR